MSSQVYCFSSTKELMGLSQKYVDYLKTEGIISFALFDAYRVVIDSQPKCSCPNCKGENHHLESHFSFEEKWSSSDNNESGEKSSAPSSRQLNPEKV